MAQNHKKVSKKVSKRGVFGQKVRPILINRTALLLANQVNGMGNAVVVYAFPLEEVGHVPVGPLFRKVEGELKNIRIDSRDDYLSNNGAPIVSGAHNSLLTGHPATARALRKWTGIRPRYAQVAIA